MIFQIKCIFDFFSLQNIEKLIKINKQTIKKNILDN